MTRGRHIWLIMVLCSTAAHCDPLGVGSESPRTAWVSVHNASGAGRIPTATESTFIAVVGGDAAAYSLESGEQVWSTTLRSYNLGTRRVIHHKGLVALAGGDSVHVLSADAGMLLWSYLPESQPALGEVAAYDNTLYVGTRMHHVHALNLNTGTPEWIADIGRDWPWLGVVRGVVRSGDTVYAAAIEYLNEFGGLRRGVVVALDAHTGTELWRFQDPDDESDVIATPLVTDRLLVLSGFYDGSVKAVDRFTGQLAWRFRNAVDAFGPTYTVARDGNVIYAATQGGLHALDLETGAVIWERTEIMLRGGNHVAVCGDILLYANQAVHAINPTDGGVIATLIASSDDDFAISGFAVSGNRAAFVGRYHTYGVDCGGS